MYCTVELRCHDHLLISFLPLIAFLLLVSFSSSFLLCSVVAPMIPSCLSTLSVMCFLQTLGLARSEQDISKGPPNQQTQQAQALPFPPKPFHELTPAWAGPYPKQTPPLFAVSWAAACPGSLISSWLLSSSSIFYQRAKKHNYLSVGDQHCWSLRAVVKPRHRLSKSAPAQIFTSRSSWSQNFWVDSDGDAHVASDISCSD